MGCARALGAGGVKMEGRAWGSPGPRHRRTVGGPARGSGPGGRVRLARDVRKRTGLRGGNVPFPPVNPCLGRRRRRGRDPARGPCPHGCVGCQASGGRRCPARRPLREHLRRRAGAAGDRAGGDSDQTGYGPALLVLFQENRLFGLLMFYSNKICVKCVDTTTHLL